MRIRLEVAEHFDLEALERHHPTSTYRLRVLLRFRQSGGWSASTQAIVDTGAPYSVMPNVLAALIRLISFQKLD
jgi:hypothetical protein